MTSTDEVCVRTRVSLDRSAAFALFTDQVDAWWAGGSRYRRISASRVRFTESLLLEEGEEESRVIARVTAWDAPSRLALEMDGDPVVIAFAECDGGTEVTVHQRRGAGLTVFQSTAGLFWADLLARWGRVVGAVR